MSRYRRFEAHVSGHPNQLSNQFSRDALSLRSLVTDLDHDALEDRSVEHLAQRRRSFFVRNARVGDVVHGALERLHDVVDLGDGLALPLGNLCLFVGDAQLFGLQDLDGNGLAVVELHQLLLLSGELVESSGVTFSFGGGGLGLLADELADGLTGPLLLLVGKPRSLAVQFHDRSLECRDGRVGGYRTARWVGPG